MDIRDSGSTSGITKKDCYASLSYSGIGFNNRGLDLSDESYHETENVSTGDSTGKRTHIKKSKGKFSFKLGIGLRHVLNILTSLAMTVSYMNRTNLNIAIVAMVSSNTSGVDSDEGDVCPLSDSVNSTSEADTSGGEFDWDEKTQGMLLGCFYYGYTVSNFFAGMLAEFLGGRLLLGLSVIGTSVLSLLSPLCARISTELFIAVRVQSGLSQGPLIPTIFTLMASWIPAQEKARFSSFLFPGSHVGTVLTMSLGGLLASSDFLGGWPSIFYVFGVAGLLWSIPWFIVIRDTPEKHPFISSAELAHIRENASSIKSAESPTVPWFSILKSLPFWSLIAVALGDGIGFFTLFTEIPTYLKNIQRFDMASNGLLSAAPYLSMIIFTPIFGLLVSHISAKGLMGTTGIRKLSTSIGLYGSCLSLIAMCFVNCNSTLAIVFLCLSVSINGAKYCGALISEQDIAPNYAGVLKGFINAVSSLTGIIAPMIAGAITQGNQTLSAWRTVFSISAVTYFAGGTIFLIFGTAEVQPWNDTKKEKGSDVEKY